MIQGSPLEWSPFLLALFGIFDLVSSAGQSLFSIDCLYEERVVNATCSESDVFDPSRSAVFFTQALFVALLPVACALFFGAYWGARSAFRKLGRFKKNRGRTYYQYFTISMIVVLFFLYPTLSRTSLKFFSCSSESFGTEKRFLEADFNLECWGSTHASWAILGFAMIFVYALGTPLYLYVKLRRNVKHETKYKSVYGFVYRGFKERFYYWEIVILGRKFCFACISVLVRPLGADLQGYLGLLVLSFAYAVHAYVQPYKSNRMNNVEALALVVAWITLFIGVVISSPNIDESAALGLNWAALFANFVFLIIISSFLYTATVMFIAQTATNLKSAKSALSAKKREMSVRLTRAGSKRRAESNSSMASSVASVGAKSTKSKTSAAAPRSIVVVEPELE